MKNIFKKLIYTTIFLVLTLTVGSITDIYAQEESNISDFKIATYFTGIGCPHCSVASPYIKNVIKEYPNFLVIEYEVYEETKNARLITKYHDTYNIGMGIPVIFFNEDIKLVGGLDVKNNLIQNLSAYRNYNTVQLSDETTTLDQLDLNTLERYPRIYRQGRVAIRKSLTTLTDDQNIQILSFLTSNLSEWSKEIWEGELVTSQVIRYPGGNSTYEHALRVNGWVLQWNGDVVETKTEYCNDDEIIECEESISLTKILGLALADSINPCAISVLLLMLLAITTYNPKDRKQILFSGLAFILAVVLMYMIYGFLIIEAFQFLQSITLFKVFLYKGLGVVAFLLGILEIKDFIKYRPGTAGTEMPMFLRPKMKNVVSKITSPLGAFSMGLFVTVFLLPCTIGPYVILGGMLSTLDFLKSIPYLLTYNIIFVLPMIVVTFLIFFGMKNIKDVSDWRNTNVRKMHLVSGILMIILSIIMFFGIL